VSLFCGAAACVKILESQLYIYIAVCCNVLQCVAVRCRLRARTLFERLDFAAQLHEFLTSKLYTYITVC